MLAEPAAEAARSSARRGRRASGRARRPGPSSQSAAEDERQLGGGRRHSSAISQVCGCGRPASRRARAVSSLSCAATSAHGRLSTVTPAAVAGRARASRPRSRRAPRGRRAAPARRLRARGFEARRAGAARLRDAQSLGGGGERLVRLRASVRDDDEPHAAEVRRSRRSWGSPLVTLLCATWVRLRACSRRRSASG